MIPLAERFWAKVYRMDEDECWPWMGARQPSGHGRISEGRRASWAGARALGAHRVSWELRHQRSLKPGDVVRHTCDNPRCVNPRHLVVGSQRDNVNDMDRRGRRRPAMRQLELFE